MLASILTSFWCTQQWLACSHWRSGKSKWKINLFIKICLRTNKDNIPVLLPGGQVYKTFCHMLPSLMTLIYCKATACESMSNIADSTTTDRSTVTEQTGNSTHHLLQPITMPSWTNDKITTSGYWSNNAKLKLEQHIFGFRKQIWLAKYLTVYDWRKDNRGKMFLSALTLDLYFTCALFP